MLTVNTALTEPKMFSGPHRDLVLITVRIFSLCTDNPYMSFQSGLIYRKFLSRIKELTEEVYQEVYLHRSI